jgi:hypothetical protein
LPGLAPAGHLLFCFAKKGGKKGDPKAVAPCGGPQKTRRQGGKRDKLAFGSDSRASLSASTPDLLATSNGIRQSLFVPTQVLFFLTTLIDRGFGFRCSAWDAAGNVADGPDKEAQMSEPKASFCASRPVSHVCGNPKGSGLAVAFFAYFFGEAKK